jgi:hypothetical protein
MSRHAPLTGRELDTSWETELAEVLSRELVVGSVLILGRIPIQNLGLETLLEEVTYN